MDLKILQIDADLRKPQIHARLGLNNLTGLSNLLTNKELKVSEVTQSVPGFKNWDVISSGTKPPDPTRLLNSQKMRTFIKEIKESNKYDLIVFDTPPVIGLADSLLVSEKSDGLILLVSTNSVNKNLTKIEKIKKFFIINEKFSIENGMLTPTLKLKRYKIVQKYKNEFEKLY